MGLAKIVLRRIAFGLLTLWLVSIVVFAATTALPGDAARAIMGQQATPERLEALREKLNLDRSFTEQYTDWIGGVVTGDLGASLALHEVRVSSVISSKVVNSLFLVSVAAVIGIPVSILVGALSARYRDGWFDMTASVITLALAALPEFVLGVCLILLFATSVLQVLPAVSPISRDVSFWSQLDMVILPAMTLVLAVAPYITRILRASMIEVLESEYVAMARLKGMRERIVLARHALPNALVPTIQGTALQLAWLAGGIVVVEYLFGFPGIGQALVEAVENRDVPVIQALTLLIAGVYVVTNLAADILTILVTPRLRTGLR
jgi:peptide/nickel transport system permease protein